MNRSFQAVFVLLGLLGAAVAAIGRPEPAVKSQPQYAPLQEKVSLTQEVVIDPSAARFLSPRRDTTAAILPADRSPALVSSSPVLLEVSAAIGYEGSCGLDSITGEIYASPVGTNQLSHASLSGSIGPLGSQLADTLSSRIPLIRLPAPELDGSKPLAIAPADPIVIKGNAHLVIWKRMDHKIRTIDRLEVAADSAASVSLAASRKPVTMGSMSRLADDFFPLLSQFQSTPDAEAPFVKKSVIPSENNDISTSEQTLDSAAQEQAHAESTSTRRLMLLSAARRQVDGLHAWLSQPENIAKLGFLHRGAAVQWQQAIDQSAIAIVWPWAIRDHSRATVESNSDSMSWSDYEATELPTEANSPIVDSTDHTPPTRAVSKVKTYQEAESR